MQKGSAKNASAGVESTRRGQAKGNVSGLSVSDSAPACQEGALNAVVAQLNVRFGAGSVRRLGDVPPAPPALSTGLRGLDDAIGIGGLPRGRIVEIFGDAGAGKTSLALQIARQAENVLYIDSDHGLPPARLAGMTVANVDTLEEALGICEIAAEAFDLIVVDTLTALPTRAEMETPLGEKTYSGSTAELLSRTLPRLMHTLARHGCILLFVSQIRENPEVVFGNPYRTPGGRALKHYTSVRLSVIRCEFFCRGGTVSGQEVEVKVIKNRSGPIFKPAMSRILFGSGAMIEMTVG